MVISFNFSNNSYKNICIDQHYNLVTKDYDGELQIVSYHKTLNQIDDNSVKLILIPYKLNDSSIEYKCNEFIKHIRVHYRNNLYNKPICLIAESDTEIEIVENKKLQLLLTDSEYNNILNENVQTNIINSNEHSIILGQISSNIENNQTEHDVANKWGAYRLINLFKDQPNYATIYEKIYNSLAEQIFYKKRLFIDNKSNENYNPDLNKVNSLKSKINQSNIRIALIDDESKNGWYSIYSALFNEIEDIYPEIPEENINNTQFIKNEFDNFYESINKELIDKYDLFLLDLRLYEKDNLDYTQLDEINTLSGIKILQKIKKIDPTKSIIICTASNKSWSYKNILDLGADGFWNKESPLFNTSIKYSEYNLIDLLTTINSSYNINHLISKAYHAIDKIYNKIQPQDYALGEFIIRKKDLIFADLCSKGIFFDSYYKEQKYESAFIRTYTLMSEICTYLISENEGIFKSKNNENLVFCIKHKEKIERENSIIEKEIYTLTDDAEDYINEYTWSNVSNVYQYNFPQFQFLLYNIAISNLTPNTKQEYFNNLFLFRTKRNESAFTHDSLDNLPPTYSIEDILNILNIYIEILQNT